VVGISTFQWDQMTRFVIGCRVLHLSPLCRLLQSTGNIIPPTHTNTQTYTLHTHRIVPCLSVTKDEVWIGNRFIGHFYTRNETNNYDILTKFNTQKIHCTYSTQKAFSVFTSRCFVAAFNGGGSPFSGFPNYPFFSISFLLHSTTTDRVRVRVILRPTVSRPVCLGIKHTSRAYDQIFITVRPLLGC
jgi:hypothetical protein